MPNLGKESLAEASDPNSQPAVSDVAKILRQHIDTLRRAGLTHLPSGTGQYAFETMDAVVTSEVADSETAASTNGVGNSTQGSGSTGAAPVREASPNYDSGNSTGQAAVPALPSAVSTPALTSGATAPPATDGSASRPSLLSEAYGSSLDLAARQSALTVLQTEVAGCTQCDELASSRTQTVFGVGNPKARLVFLGEGPGANEDRIGEPFVGEAGQLLDKIMGACNLSRSDVYILNAVKCRPPSNRNPSQDELRNCWGYAERQLEILQPEFICCLGSVAARTLLKTTQSIGRLRRQFHAYRGSRVLVTYHPAYLLRTPSAKKHVWEDMKLLMKEMGVDLSK